MPKQISKIEKQLYKSIISIVNNAKQQLATVVNSTTTLLYWNIGLNINQHILHKERAQYGDEIIISLSKKLTIEFGKGWSEKQIRHCIRIAETFPEKEILYALSRELSWTHLRTLMYIKDELKRDFYIEICKMEKWNTRTLSKKIASMLFERTAISKKPEKQIRKEVSLLNKENKLSPDLIFKDPYFLNFLGLGNVFSEKNLEEAILKELENFILELGQGFTFVERQKSLLIDNENFKIDLLFFHRKLKRLVAIELKLGKFKASYKGQMELYLRYLEKYEMENGENTPIGLILCSEGSEEQIELLQLDKVGIRVAEYITELPSKKILQKKLQKVIKTEKERLERVQDKKKHE